LFILKTPDGLEAIAYTAEGDMRKAINNLQATHAGFETITKEHVFDVCDIPNLDKLKKIIDLCS